ncbi:hypothetical protein BH20BAC1_BH20BAC1_08800 [soil metagenome]|jgi:hypothetical protein
MKKYFRFRLAAIAVLCLASSGISTESAMGNAKSVVMSATEALTRASTISVVNALPAYPFEYFLIKI